MSTTSVGLEPGADPVDDAERDRAVLGRLLGIVLQEQGGPDLVQRLATVRAAAAALRARDVRSSERLAGQVRGLESRAALPLVRAASMHLALANVVDELSRLRHAREVDVAQTLAVDGSPPSPASAGGRPLVDIRLVLTAHPTDVARRSVLSKHRAVSRALERRDDPRLGFAERRLLDDEIGEALSIWFATNEVRAMRPRVADEVRR